MALSEGSLRRLKALAVAHGKPWGYAPLHRHLREAMDRGEWSGPRPPSAEGAGDPSEAARFGDGLTP